MVSDLLLEFLQKLMSAGDVLCGLRWVLLGRGFAWCWHGLAPLCISILFQPGDGHWQLPSCARLGRAKAHIPTRASLTPALSGPLWLLFEHRKLDLLLHRIDAVHQHAHAVAQAIGFARTLADDFARGFVVGVAVVGERVERDEA